MRYTQINFRQLGDEINHDMKSLEALAHDENYGF